MAGSQRGEGRPVDPAQETADGQRMQRAVDPAPHAAVRVGTTELGDFVDQTHKARPEVGKIQEPGFKLQATGKASQMGGQ